MATILITSAAGKVAGATFAALRGAGHKLIGLVRNPDKAQGLAGEGVELRVGDLEQPSTLKAAFTGVDRVLIIVPGEYRAPALASNALWAAREAKVKHVVRLSAVGAAHDAPTVNSRLHALSDAELKSSGLPFTILKPHFFTQNLLGIAPLVKEQSTFYFALGDAKVPMIDVRDIGEAAAKVLADPTSHVEATYTLTSAAGASMHDVAAALSSAVGKPVKYVPVSHADAVEGMKKRGADNYMVAAMGDYLAAYARGWQSEPTPDFKKITGKDPRTLADFVRDFRGAFGG
jgi:uncharacterized protein YbjT (DUF2867 family)